MWDCFGKSKLKTILRVLQSNNDYGQFQAAKQLRRMLDHKPKKYIDGVIEMGILPRLIELLDSTERKRLQLEISRILVNVTAGTTEQTKVVVDVEAVPILIEKLATIENYEIQEHIAVALDNIANDSALFRDQLIDAGLLKILLRLVDSSKCIQLTRNVVFSISNLCRGTPAPEFHKIVQCLQTLEHCVYHFDDEVIINACRALNYICMESCEERISKIQAVIDSLVCPRLVHLLHSENIRIVAASLRVIGNIAIGKDSQVQALLDHNVLHALLYLLYTNNLKIVKNVCSTLSNIASGNVQQIQAIIDANIFPAIIKVLGYDQLKMEAIWVIRNALCGATFEQIDYLVMIGCMPAMSKLLTSDDSDTVHVAIDGIEIILKAGEMSKPNPFALLFKKSSGSTKVAALMGHERAEVSQYATRMMEQYFGDEI